MTGLLLAQIHYSSDWGHLTPEHILAVLLPVLGFLVFAILMLAWYLHKRNRMRHEEQMLALQQGLTLDRDGGPTPGRGWIWIALGVPVVCNTAALIGTGIILDYARSSGYNTGLIMAAWIVSGAVSLAAVIIGGLGFVLEQRFRQQAPSRLIERAPSDNRSAAVVAAPRMGEEAVRKQESP